MGLFVLHTPIILLCLLAFESLGQDRFPALATYTGDKLDLISAQPFIPLDKLVTPRISITLLK